MCYICLDSLWNWQKNLNLFWYELIIHCGLNENKKYQATLNVLVHIVGICSWLCVCVCVFFDGRLRAPIQFDSTWVVENACTHGTEYLLLIVCNTYRLRTYLTRRRCTTVFRYYLHTHSEQMMHKVSQRCIWNQCTLNAPKHFHWFA